MGEVRNARGKPRPDIICFCLEGNGTRESHRGKGYSVGETMFTLNSVEQHIVCVVYGREKEGTDL